MRNSCWLLIGTALLIIFGGSNQVGLAIEECEKSFSYDSYASVLKSHVDDTGMVNYSGLKATRDKLDEFSAAAASLQRKVYDKWGERDRIAFWLNAYNAFTLQAIIDHYPIKPSFLKSRVYPKNSIRQIPGVWDKIGFDVMGQDLTLEHIEHEILREEFDEPRIHMAMVCAAMGCPPLLNEPYSGVKLDVQLDDRTRRFLDDRTKFRIDRDKDTLYLSPIFKWFAEDFTNKYSPKKEIAKHGRKVSAVLNFISGYLKQADRNYVLAGKFKIKYLKYDWSLNEQTKGKKNPNKSD
jgi:hypothetical protein